MYLGLFARPHIHTVSLTLEPRSPSPPPQYDNYGRRVNTREYRYRKRLEDERHKLIEKAMKTIPNYHPPQDYRRPTKTQEKVYVPVNDYPEINFSEITNPLTFLTKSLFLSCQDLVRPLSCRFGSRAVAKPDIHLTYCPIVSPLTL